MALAGITHGLYSAGSSAGTSDVAVAAYGQPRGSPRGHPLNDSSWITGRVHGG